MYIMKKDHKQRGSFRLGLRAKILGVSLPVTIIMVIVMIAIAYNVSEADIMASSQSLLSTSAKDQRLEPVYTAEQKCRHLHQIVPSADVILFMADDIILLLFPQTEGNINPR